MKKIYSSIMLFSFICMSTERTYAEFSLQEKVNTISTSLINNAWRIAGTAFLATSAISAAITAKLGINEFMHYGTSDAIKTTALCSLVPAATGILGLLCLNVHAYLNQQNKLKKHSRRDIIALRNSGDSSNDVHNNDTQTVIVRTIIGQDTKTVRARRLDAVTS